MSIAVTHSTAREGWLARALSTASARLQAWRERRVALAELESLDDRTLADLGIRRHDIDYVVRTGRRPANDDDADVAA